MTNTLKVTEFSAAVRGYHYYGSIWFPEKEEQLDCSHDFGNVFDVFAIKTCKLDGTVVGHLPREISMATKFLLDRGAQISVVLTSTDYRRSPLVQGGFEIACKVIVNLPGTEQNHLLMDRYVETVKVKYIPNMKLYLDLFLKNHLLQLNQQTKREIHRTLAIQRKSRSQTMTSGHCFAEKRKEETKSKQQLSTTSRINNIME